MPIDPHNSLNPGSIAGIVGKQNDLDRRLRALEATRTVIGAGAITSTKVGENAITTGHISANSINAGHIQAGIISASHIAANSINATHIQALAINAGHIQANAITAGHLSANSVTAGAIAAGAVTAGTIAAGAVTATEIAVSTLGAISSNLGAITAGTITGAIFQTASGGARVRLSSAGLVGYGLDGVTEVFKIDSATGIASFTGVANIDPSSVIPGGAISDATITGAKIAAGAITANHIQAGTITAESIGIQFGGKNMLWNANFEDPLVGERMWEATNGAIFATPSQVVPISGRKVLRLTSTGGEIVVGPYSGQTPPHESYFGSYQGTVDYPGFYGVIPNLKYSFNYYVASPTVTRQALARMNWYDGLLRQQLPAPTITNSGPFGSGTLMAGTYFWRITAVNSNGETTASNEVSVTVGANGQAGFEATFAPDADDTPFPTTKLRIYRRTSAGSYVGYYEINATPGVTNSFLDGGLVMNGAGAPPVTNTAATVATKTTSSAQVATEVAAANPGVASMTSPTVVTSTLLVTGTQPSVVKYAKWVRPTVSATVPAGGRFVRPTAHVLGTANAEVHFFDAFTLEPGDPSSGFSPRADEVLPGSVGATQITPNSITTDQILAGGIQADRLTVSSLSAITANMGTITAGTINGVTITGGTIRTAVSGTRIEMDSASLRAYSGSTQTLSLSSGYLTLGQSSGSHMELGSYGIYGFDHLNQLSLAIDTRGNITNYLRGSTYNQVAWLEGNQSVAVQDINTGTATGSGGTGINIHTIRAISSNTNPGARAQLLAYNKGGLGSSYVQLAAEYTEASGNYVFVRNNNGYANILTSSHHSSFLFNGGYNRWTGVNALFNYSGTGGYGINPGSSVYNTTDFGAGNVAFGSNPDEYIVDGYLTNTAFFDFCSFAFGNMNGSSVGYWIANNAPNYATGGFFLTVQGRSA